MQFELLLWLRKIFTGLWTGWQYICVSLSCRMYVASQRNGNEGKRVELWKFVVPSIFFFVHQLYSGCSCISYADYSHKSPYFDKWQNLSAINGDEVIISFHIYFQIPIPKWIVLCIQSDVGGFALSGPCPVNCYTEFVTFLSVMCLMKLVGSTGRSTNFLISIR